MTHQRSKTLPSIIRPLITSYDSSDEHSLEHYVYVHRLVEDEDDSSPEMFATFAGTGLAPDHEVAF